MSLDEQFLQDLTDLVWTTVVGLHVEKGAPAALERESITTSVDITGAWEGTLSLSLSRLLGQRLASAMLECPESETTAALVVDVVSELANVLGGNVKGVLPSPCKLSLPRVDSMESNDISDAADAQCLWFDCAGMPFSVTVRPRSPEARSQS